MAKYYMGSYLTGSSPCKNLSTTLLLMPLKAHEEEQSDSLLVIDFDSGYNLLGKHRPAGMSKLSFVQSPICSIGASASKKIKVRPVEFS
jgi:hypothetical protein